MSPYELIAAIDNARTTGAKGLILEKDVDPIAYTQALINEKSLKNQGLEIEFSCFIAVSENVEYPIHRCTITWD
jgi:hypothetical protein